ncbi:1-acyl-sn-glycerol-3-phosphate acyltransferase [Pseudohongiella spirulinae]|uniref:Cytochrome oxidase maturation protein Cbb3 n=1 Tax=Pseudohongiella spirulinae TaxID=1249552 RepID=A0A0S2KD59_9GAMM|nr:1-acyl-sn-glycerol-3-phosphate acyltransferase [Pseudohongiella spirulinae]ALO46020.1 cytochrome oxidase maturation protein Cbb3 [Pseudohongiella spirulinae]
MTDTPLDDPFHDIRPYNDDEIRPVLDNLLSDDGFVSSISQFNYPRFYRFFPTLLKSLARRKLRQQLKDVNSVASMQDVIAGYMDQMIERTTTELTHSGLDGLSKSRSYLFISNHRDIAMDPAFVNYMLYHAGFETLYIAIGDNLLKKPFVTDLMRLNKSFIVKRSLKGRELLKSSRQLSEYIHHCVGQHRNVWIAQREGRAKDGLDRTETALLKMLAMARRGEGLAAALNQLHIVPVSISYEFDPCDSLKADELHQKQTTGAFVKTDQSDIQSIVTGMVGFKGRVHVAFGEPLDLDSDDDELAARAIDAQVIRNYRLHTTNVLALQQLRAMPDNDLPVLSDEGEQLLADFAVDRQVADRFNQRIAAMPAEIRPLALRMYANPVLSRFADQAF